MSETDRAGPSAEAASNIAVHLTALRARRRNLPVGIKLIAEGSEEQGTGGVDPAEIEHMALAEALFLASYQAAVEDPPG
jgi:cysteinylglycine-S-conjugate dipeptidase